MALIVSGYYPDLAAQLGGIAEVVARMTCNIYVPVLEMSESWDEWGFQEDIDIDENITVESKGSGKDKTYRIDTEEITVIMDKESFDILISEYTIEEIRMLFHELFIRFHEWIDKGYSLTLSLIPYDRTSQGPVLPDMTADPSNPLSATTRYSIFPDFSPIPDSYIGAFGYWSGNKLIHLLSWAEALSYTFRIGIP